MSAEGLKVSHLKWFVATCEMRGHRLVNYAKKNDSSAAEISALNTIWKFKGQKEDNKKRKKDPPGNVSVVAAKVAFSDLFIAFRKEMGPATFGGEKYEGSCPVIYQWLGSLAAMYSPEEDSAPFAAYEKYISDYEDFQSWYLGVREKAAKAQPPNPDYVPPSEEKKIASLNRSRSFYFLALSSFSIKVRRSWSEGKYPKDVDENVKLEKTPVDEVIEIVDERYTQNYKTDSVSQKS